MINAPAYDLAPLTAIALFGALLAIVPFLWVWRRQRQAGRAGRLRALTVLTLFLTFDLVLFGAFTRLTDSGLGCPDWPGCYGSASPLGAGGAIGSAQAALPSGPVTHGKAWVEMTHRYLATAAGALITLGFVMSLVGLRGAGSARPGESSRAASSPVPGTAPWWAAATLVWVCGQGAFGALTVTMKLYPAIVTLHLLGGIGLLVLLALQAESLRPAPLPLPRPLHRAVWAVALLSVLQVALGGWVSTNYAVLACSEFPTCQGQWWPPMDFDHGFTVLRELGAGKGGGYLPFTALTAIHYTHRLMAYAVLAALLWLAWRLHATGARALQRWALAFVGVAAWQLASGLGNVLLGWPLLAAVAHTGGAAALITLLAVLLARARPSNTAATTLVPAPVPTPGPRGRMRPAP